MKDLEPEAKAIKPPRRPPPSIGVDQVDSGDWLGISKLIQQLREKLDRILTTHSDMEKRFRD